jgi:hypothetical protein
MVKRAITSNVWQILTVHVPMTFRRCGGRKLAVTPEGALWPPSSLVERKVFAR